MNARPATRGRPRVADPTQISRIALAQIARDGWAETTMTSIAQRSGISAPTLFRYFPTKADMLWHGMDESSQVFRSEFDHSTIDDSDTVLAIIDSYRRMLESDDNRLSLVRERAAIIATDTAAAEASWRKFEEWRTLVTEMLHSRHPDASPVQQNIHGAMIWSALWTALTMWAVSDDDTPSRQLDAARELLAGDARA